MRKLMTMIFSMVALLSSAQTITLHGSNGNAFEVKMRRALPVSAPRVRYPGFSPDTLLLKKGTIRRAGSKPLPCDILMYRDVAVKLRDGVTIYTDVFLPAKEGHYPAILAWSPYGKEIGGQQLDDVPGRSGVAADSTSGLEKFEAPDPAYWCAHGYVIVNPDKRGAYMSQGNLLYWGHEDALDGVDVINWIAAQPWSNEKVGMAGNSWLCVSQWFIASEKPKYLTAIAPWEGFSDHYRESGTRGGIPMPEFSEQIAETFSSQYGLLEDQPWMIANKPYMCDYWLDKAPRVENITIPAYVVASYTNPVHTHGTFAAYRRLSSKDKWLRVHNTNEWQDFYTHQEDLRKFFDHYLKGIDNGWEKTPKVRLSVLNPGGQDIIDRVENEWPLARTQYTRLYLNGKNQTLQSSKVKGTERQTYDSEATGSNSLTYRLRFNKPTEITGYMKLHLWVSADEYNDMDLAVKVKKLDSHGKEVVSMGSPEVATGYLRVSMRKLDPAKSTESEPEHLFTKDAEEMLEQGKVYPVEIELWPIGLLFGKGEYLQLTVGAYQPGANKLGFGASTHTIPVKGMTYDPNDQNVELMTIGGNADEVEDQAEVVTSPATHNKGRHSIYSGGKYDSYLYVPIIPAK